MALRRAIPPVLALAALAGGCNKDYPNPFASPNRTLPPSANAALLFSSGVYSTRPGAPRELYSAGADGSGLGRLTFCDAEAATCDTVEASPGGDRNRVVALRVTDSNKDDTLDAATDGQALVFIDLSRSVEAVVVAASERVSGAHWLPTSDAVAFSALGQGNLDDLYRIDYNGANRQALTDTATIRERRPRIDPAGRVAVYERIESGGKGEIWIWNSALNQVRVTSGGTGSAPLPGTPYVVGSDADPDYSPDGRSIVFRRLTNTGNGGLGTWDIVRVAPDGTAQTVVVTGPVFRGPPDWGTQGIVFTEIDTVAGTAQLVVIQPDGTGRQVLVTQGASFGLSNPRWLP